MLLRTAGLSVADIDNVTFLLNALIITHSYTAHSELFTLITRHYMMQILKQAYRVLGAFDVIGNPLSLMSTLGTGVYDFFYEPAHSLVTHPQNLIKALARVCVICSLNSISSCFLLLPSIDLTHIS
jgi:vacuolar protein sorting-associated protein 13A/C